MIAKLAVIVDNAATMAIRSFLQLFICFTSLNIIEKKRRL
jgi:hypothetical protein